jgi:hypothetical protein
MARARLLPAIVKPTLKRVRPSFGSDFENGAKPYAAEEAAALRHRRFIDSQKKLKVGRALRVDFHGIVSNFCSPTARKSSCIQ